jgi:hypothetical protein
MSFTHRVMLHAAALALPALLLSAQALAQEAQTKEPDRTVGSGVRMEEPSLPQAPVGHRQPRASDLPATRERDPSDDWLNRLNRETDRKLEICRGC